MLRFGLRSWMLTVTYAAVFVRLGMFIWAVRTYGLYYGARWLMRW